MKHGLQGCGLAAFLLLSACDGIPPSLNPFTETAPRESPPGARDPYPNLGTVPARPARPDVGALRAVQTGLIADRSTAGQEGYVTTSGAPGRVPELRLGSGPAVAAAPPAPPVLPGIRQEIWPAPRAAAAEVAPAQADSLRLFEAGRGTRLSAADTERLRQFVQTHSHRRLRVTGLGDARAAQARIQAVVAELQQNGFAEGDLQTDVQSDGRGVLVSLIP